MDEPSSPQPSRPSIAALAKKLPRDPLFRRMVVASLFAGAFVWAAVDAFDVSTETVSRYFLLSVGLVVVLIAAALGAAFLFRLLRKFPGPAQGRDERPK